MKLDDFCYINPTEKLERNQLYDFVEMADLIPGNRYVHAKTKEIFNGSYSKFTNKDVLMAKITPCLENGKISQYIGDNKAFGSTEFNIFRAKEGTSDPDFLYYLISSDYVRDIAVKSMTGACGRQRANTDEIKQIEVNNIHIDVQRKIAKILSNYDDLIENNNKRIKILEEMAQKIYKEWFVDFKYPGHETATFKDTELGKIPKGWDIKTLEEVSNVMVRGVTPEYQDGSQRYIINQKVNRGFQLALENLKELSLSLYVPEEKYAKKRDILINSLGEGTIGRIHYFNGKNNYFAVDQHMTICRFKENIAEYLYFYLSSTDGQARLSSLKTGSTNMTMLNISLLRNLKVVLPNKNLLSSYSKYIRIIFDEKNALEEKNHTLKTTRDLLLPRLMSGEIDVENLEIA